MGRAKGLMEPVDPGYRGNVAGRKINMARLGEFPAPRKPTLAPGPATLPNNLKQFEPE